MSAITATAEPGPSSFPEKPAQGQVSAGGVGYAKRQTFRAVGNGAEMKLKLPNNTGALWPLIFVKKGVNNPALLTAEGTTEIDLTFSGEELPAGEELLVIVIG